MLKYIGIGEHKIGIPARDLSDEEVDQYGGEEYLIATGLYVKPAKPGRKPAAADLTPGNAGGIKEN
jgi:hypothetical protein